MQNSNQLENGQAGSWTIIFIAAIVSLGGFLFGFDASVISGVTKFIKPQFELDDLQLGWVVSAPTFSAMFAMLVAGSISDRVGRKRVLIAVAFLYLLSAVWSAYAGGYQDLVIARMIGGIAFGAALVLAPVYIAEIAPAHQRGRLVSIQQLNIVLGFSAAYFSNYWLQGSLGSQSGLTEANIWRWMFGIETIPALLYLAALFFVPRSPRWLLLKGKETEAKAVLSRLAGAKEGQLEIDRIKQTLASTESQSRVRLSAVFNKKMRFVLLIALGLGILQQITGVNAIYFYATSIFEQSGVGANAAFAQAVWVGIINVIFTLIAMALIDRMGRKPLILIGLAGITLSMALTAYGFNQATYTLTGDQIQAFQPEVQTALAPVADISYHSDLAFKTALKSHLGPKVYAQNESELVEKASQMPSLLILFGILGFVASFAVSLGPVMWVMLSEMFPNRVRGITISLIGFINSFTSWVVQFIFPWEISNWGNATTYLIYALFAGIGFVLMFRALPETKGKSLETLEKELLL